MFVNGLSVGACAFAASALLLSLGCVAPDDPIEDLEIIEPGYTVEAKGNGNGNGKGNKTCSIKCLAPPYGCHYENSLLTGKCNKVTCGDLVCEPLCAISCVAPPEGCHYEGALLTGDCKEVTCGTVVCP